jgi:hypothetical protein
MKMTGALVVALLAFPIFATPANAIVPCVSEICGGYSPRMRGVSIAPSSTSFILSDVRRAYPWVWQPLFPLSYPGAYDFWTRVFLYRYF